jgi:GTP-binding protein
MDDVYEEGRKLFAGESRFVFGLTSAAGELPAADRPEVVFAGRSNVGKSSLINAVTGRKKLVRTSSTPGCTAQVNFFSVRDAIYLVDVPGYGYAKASKKEMQHWKNLIESYFVRRAGVIARVFLLLDSRRGGLKDADADLAAWLQSLDVPVQAVLTKVDKASAAEAKACTDEAVFALAGARNAEGRVVPTSVKTGLGIDELRAEMARIAARGAKTPH